MPPIAAVKLRRACRRARGLRLGAGVVGALWLAGCSAAPRPPVTPRPGAAAGEAAQAARARQEERLAGAVLAELRERAAQVRGLSGRAEIVLSAPGWGGASWVEAVVLAQAPSSLRLRGYAGPVAVFDMASGAERFTFYAPGRKRVWSGPPETLPRLTGFPGRPADIVEALLGRPFGTPDSLRLVSADGDQATVRWPRDGARTVEARIRRDLMVASRITLYEEGVAVARLDYEDFLKEGVGWWPRQVSLTWPADGARLALTFHELKLNPEFARGVFELSAPEGASRVDLGARRSGGGPWGDE